MLAALALSEGLTKLFRAKASSLHKIFDICTRKPQSFAGKN